MSIRLSNFRHNSVVNLLLIKVYLIDLSLRIKYNCMRIVITESFVIFVRHKYLSKIKGVKFQMKRTVAFFLSLIMIFSVFQVAFPVFAADYGFAGIVLSDSEVTLN